MILRTALTALALLFLAQPSRADDGALGWLIFEYPRTDEHYGKIRGQARPIHSAFLIHESKSISSVVVTYLDSQAIPVKFYYTSHAEAFLQAIQDGKSVDLTSCAHASASWDTPRDRVGCFDRVYKLEFHCDLLDTPRLIDNPGVDKDNYAMAGSGGAPEVTISELRCMPSGPRF